MAIENGTHSIWIKEQLRGYGHEVIVANVQELQAISRSDRKSDRVDAEKLARYARLDPSILRPISHRSMAMQQDLTVVRARDVLVRLRTATINAVRGLVKPRFPVAQISNQLLCGTLPFHSSARSLACVKAAAPKSASD